MQVFPNRIQRLINEGYSFNFGDYISRGFDIMNKNVGLFIGFIIVWGMISSVPTFFPVIYGINLLELVMSIFVSPCLMIGFAMACKDTEDNKSLIFERFFDGFKHWKGLAIVALIQSAIIILPSIAIGGMAYTAMDLVEWTRVAVDNPLTYVVFFAFFILIFYIAICWQFAPMFVVFENMAPWPAMEASRKIINKKWFIFFGFAFTVGILMMLGIIGLFIGVLYTIPAGMAMFYACYSDIVGFADENEEMDILDHFVEMDS